LKKFNIENVADEDWDWNEEQGWFYDYKNGWYDE